MLSNSKQTGFSSWHSQMVKIALCYFHGLKLQVGLAKCSFIKMFIHQVNDKVQQCPI